MRVVIAPESSGDALDAAACSCGRRCVPTGLDPALDWAGLVVTGGACSDRRSLRATPVGGRASPAAVILPAVTPLRSGER